MKRFLLIFSDRIFVSSVDRGIAVLHARVRSSLAIAGGIATPDDGIKAILVGGDAVQMISAIPRNGATYFTVMREGSIRWGRIATIHINRRRAWPYEPPAHRRSEFVRTSQLSAYSPEQDRPTIAAHLLPAVPQLPPHVRRVGFSPPAVRFRSARSRGARSADP